MDMLQAALDVFLHLDAHLQTIVSEYGTATYILLFLVIFCETGLIMAPFLPGDSLLFATGAVASGGALSFPLLLLLLSIAAIVGDSVNYAAGRAIGPRIFRWDTGIFLNKEYLERTRLFYEAHGGKTIIIARFIPIIRTFAPFIAGMGKMQYRRFSCFNIVGGILWVLFFMGGGYAFGNIPIVRENFSLVILGIIGVSLLPTILEYIHHRRKYPQS